MQAPRDQRTTSSVSHYARPLQPRANRIGVGAPPEGTVPTGAPLTTEALTVLTEIAVIGLPLDGLLKTRDADWKPFGYPELRSGPLAARSIVT